MDTSNYNQPTIDLLNAILRGELAAVETYDQVIALIKDEMIPELEESRTSHIARVPLLSARIKALDGIPSSTSGAWVSFVTLVAGGAKLFSRGAALSALEEGEDHNLVDYFKAVAQLDAASREMVESVLLPAQERTHRLMGMLTANKKHHVSMM